MNWALFGLCVTAALALVWVWLLTRRRWAWPGLFASLGCLLCAGINSAAPFRGAIDPDYIGYAFGLVGAERGLSVTFVAGAIFLASALSALLAVARREGPALWFVAATCAALTVIIGVPTAMTAIRDPTGNVIQFGEYLTVPGLVGTLVLLLLLAVPLVVGAIWATHAALRSAR